ncbi:hypothetical protein PRZ48_008498 [Zasmidium cellare]|uniref:N2227-domain-containing protein n=1 Tax=Zasmidium cellare TaxID=395010 RepID=A0ABR0EG09_ZASCE|nr:hypothetical protein PRZ48_008498 [Zasmidium cellare]
MNLSKEPRIPPPEFPHGGPSSKSPQQCQDPSILDLFNLQSKPGDQRHDLERERVLHEIDRRHGRWNNKHPRWSILEALHGYDRYREIAGAEIDRFEGLYKHVAKEHKKILESTITYSKNFDITRSLLDRNTLLTQAVVENALSYYDISRPELDAFIADFEAGQDQKAKDNKFKMLRTHTSHALKHMVRDWSVEGHAEREATFPYILQAVAEHLHENSDEEYRVLVPGAGLGKLGHDLALLDPARMEITLNEKDEFMNLAYRYITSPSATQQTLHPFLETWSHARTRADILRPITLLPPPPRNVLLHAGDFTHLPPTPLYSAIATLFFIDTARDLVAYLTHIHSLLEPGGIWINAGPLLYGSAPFVQLTLEEVVAVAEAVGFSVERRREAEVVYNFNGTVLLRNGFVVEFWVGRKMGEGERGRTEGKRKGWIGW